MFVGQYFISVKILPSVVFLLFSLCDSVSVYLYTRVGVSIGYRPIVLTFYLLVRSTSLDKDPYQFYSLMYLHL